MRRLVTLVSPVEYEQKIVIYEDDNKIDYIETNTDNFYTEVMSLIKKYDLKEIRLLGAKKYAQGVKDNLNKIILTQYEENQINILLK